MKTRAIILVLGLLAAVSSAQNEKPADSPSISNTVTSIEGELQASVAELANLREALASEKIPLARELRELEAELSSIRSEYQQVTRVLDGRRLDLSTLTADNKARLDESGYVSHQMREYLANFESRLHIAELQRYRTAIDAAKLAPENSNLTPEQVFETQSALLTTSLDRIVESLGGTRFEGNAVDPTGIVKQGSFVLFGPVAYFRAGDGSIVGTVDQKLGSNEPTITPFPSKEDSDAATALVLGTAGMMPFDPTLGNAHKIAETQETLLEHIKKGGPIMVPIFVLAGLALLVSIYKWLRMAFIFKPSKRSMRQLLEMVHQGDKESALVHAEGMPGPTGAMLLAGVQHLDEPKELIEEIMYEKVMATRLSVQGLLPFIAITSTAAPLFGLLGTVTGIMNTFTLMTVFGTGDVKTLSSGISEALITTEYGLIVAIPSLLIHAFLSRKAKGVIDGMEKSAVALVNQVALAQYEAQSTPSSGLAATGVTPVRVGV